MYFRYLILAQSPRVGKVVLTGIKGGIQLKVSFRNVVWIFSLGNLGEIRESLFFQKALHKLK